jgi:hypothetical protein
MLCASQYHRKGPDHVLILAIQNGPVYCIFEKLVGWPGSVIAHSVIVMKRLFVLRAQGGNINITYPR